MFGVAALPVGFGVCKTVGAGTGGFTSVDTDKTRSMAKELSSKDRKKLSKKSFAVAGKAQISDPGRGARPERAGPSGAAWHFRRAEDRQGGGKEAVPKHRKEEEEEDAEVEEEDQEVVAR